MHFDAKKTTARQVPFDQDVFDAVVAYQKQIKAEDEDIVFPPGQSKQPTNKYVNWMIRFFKKFGEDVQSHDFRATTITNHYMATKDIVQTQQFVGHSSVNVTRLYIKVDQTEMLEKRQALMR